MANLKTTYRLLLSNFNSNLFFIKLFLVLIFLSLKISSIAQFWTWDTTLNTKIINERQEHIYRPTNSKIFINHTTNNLYFKISSPYNHQLDLNHFDKGLDFYRINLQNYQIDSFFIKIPPAYITKMHPSDLLSSFITNDSFAIVELYGKDLLFFKKDSNNTFNFVKAINNKFCFRNEFFVLNDSNFLLVNISDYNILDCNYKTVIGILNSKTFDIDKNIVFSKYKGIEFAKNLHKWVDVSKNLIVFCEPTSFIVNIFDHKLNLLDKFNIKKETESTFPEIYKPNKIPKSDRIEKIYLINDSTLLISIINDSISANEREVQIWKLGKINTLISKSILNIQMPNQRLITEITKDNQWHSLFWVNTPEFVFFNSKAVELNSTYQPPFWLSNPDINYFKSQIKEYNKLNRKTIGITLYNILNLK
jgi:hypothetical protein